jgi:hypothetical protein
MKSTTFNIPPNPVEAHKLLSGPIWQLVKALTVAGHKFAIRICEQSKSREAEEKYHAMIGEIAHQIGGDLADEEDAKRILISAFRIDTRDILADEWAKFGDLRMGRGLRGEVVVLGIQSRKFTSKLASAFIEWLYAYGAEEGVTFSERFIDPDTGEIVMAKWPAKQEATC